MTAAGRVPFEYAVLRAVPRVERGESVNVGVLVYCQARGYLGARTHVDVARLMALDPSIDVVAVEHAVTAAADCTRRAGDDAGRRFRWLTAPRSTVVQPGPVHTGLTVDPDAEADRLLALLVLPLPG
ncbi:MAG: DUF3037 domain-containing protein [Candidatus Nanopelagicales bacterium]|jgi:hypothetical protein